MTKSMGDWFSSRMRFVLLIEGVGATRYMDSVYLFRASGFAQAFSRALDLGRKQERDFTNRDGDRVRWRLKEVASLDSVGRVLDGAEVYSEPVDLPPGESFAFDVEFRPEDSTPGQTV